MHSSNVLDNQRPARMVVMVRIVLFILIALMTATSALAAAPVGQTIWLRAVSTGLYVSADQNRGAFATLVADREAVAGWEQFQIVDAGGGFIALRAVSSGMYVSADTNR